MGGLNSGRKRQHTCIDDCIELDIAYLRKVGLIGQESTKGSLECKKWKETDFVKRTGYSHHVGTLYLAEGHTLTLNYEIQATNEYGRKKKHLHEHTIPLVSTPCNYGGVRWWFTAPCCQRRVRVLYINPRRGDIENMSPQCRVCLDLHYGSQMASYIERHKTYERYLLANYGRDWEQERYNELKEHYLEMTPELHILRAKAVIAHFSELLRLLVKNDLTIMKSNMRAFKTLKSEGDRRIWIEHMQRQEGELRTEEVIRLTLALIENEKEEIRYYTNGTFSDYDYYEHEQELIEQEERNQEPTEQHFEQRIIDLEAILKQVNQNKKAA